MIDVSLKANLHVTPTSDTIAATTSCARVWARVFARCQLLHPSCYAACLDYQCSWVKAAYAFRSSTSGDAMIISAGTDPSSCGSSSLHASLCDTCRRCNLLGSAHGRPDLCEALRMLPELQLAQRALYLRQALLGRRPQQQILPGHPAPCVSS